MAVVKIVDKEYNDDETGRSVPYKRLAITGVLGGEIQTLEVKLGKTELQLAELLLKSTEEEPTSHARKASEQELDAFFKKNDRSGSSDKINLEEDD